MRATAASLVRQALEQLGVRYTFGIPGVHNIELYDELASSGCITPVLVTHEGCGAFMADAISRVSDTVGTLMVVPAAGLTHAMSGIGEAYLDGIPMLVISGGVRTDLEQCFQLHDVDQQALLAPLTKATFRVLEYEDAAPMVFEAWQTALSGEPGPVFVEVPANLQLFSGKISGIPVAPGLPAMPAADPEAIEQAARLLLAGSKPGLFVGWGARHVTAELIAIAELIGAPVATTLQGLASFPADHPLHTGMGFGPAAVPAAENAFRDCDVMLAVGTRFAEIATGSFGAVPPAQLVHIDINPDTIGANHPTSVALAADSRLAVPALLDCLRGMAGQRDWQPLKEQIEADKKAYRDTWMAHDSKGRVNPERFFTALRARLGNDAIVVTDDGNHTFLTAELMPINSGGLFLSPTDFNCMGYCVPAAIACKLAHPGRQVVGIAGDGAFLMTGMELLTAAARGLGVVLFVFNDGALAQIAQAQEIPYQRRTCTDLAMLNYEAFAAAVNAEFRLASNNDDVEQAIHEALQLAATGRPVLVEVRIDYTRKTRFTEGAVKTNLARFDARNKARFIGRALWRKLKGT